MVSAGRFASDEPALFQSTVDFVQLFCDVPDPVLAVTSKIESLDARIAWTLLGTDLFQDRSYGEIGRLLSALYERFPGDKLWTLPVPTGPEIEAVVESSGASGSSCAAIPTWNPGYGSEPRTECGVTSAKSISWGRTGRASRPVPPSTA